MWHQNHGRFTISRVFKKQFLYYTKEITNIYLWFSKWTGFNDNGCDEVEAIECLELLEWNCGGSETGPVLYL